MYLIQVQFNSIASKRSILHVITYNRISQSEIKRWPVGIKSLVGQQSLVHRGLKSIVGELAVNCWSIDFNSLIGLY